MIARTVTVSTFGFVASARGNIQTRIRFKQPTKVSTNVSRSPAHTLTHILLVQKASQISARSLTWLLRGPTTHTQTVVTTELYPARQEPASSLTLPSQAPA